jgi:lactoylglutathione lyase
MRYAHTCYRVLDLDRSLAFYCDALGFQLSRKVPIREEAINAFVTPPGSPDLPLELTYNIGREEPYEIGTGYGHIALVRRRPRRHAGRARRQGRAAGEAAVPGAGRRLAPVLRA